MSIEALERKISLFERDCQRIEAQTQQTISLELAGRRLAGAEAVGDALRLIVASVKEELLAASRPIERVIGRFAGFELGVAASRGAEFPNLYLVGEWRYAADPYKSGPGLVGGLLAALETIPKHRAESVALLEVKRKRLDDLRRELERPFEHENRLAGLITRQRELLSSLDLDKDAIGTSRMDAEETRQAA